MLDVRQNINVPSNRSVFFTPDWAAVWAVPRAAFAFSHAAAVQGISPDVTV